MNEEQKAYYESFKDLMFKKEKAEAKAAKKENRIRENPIRDRLRDLVNAMLDPSCPLSGYFTDKHPPVNPQLVELIGNAAGAGSRDIRIELRRMSGPLGNVKPQPDQIYLKPATPDDEELVEIIQLRREIELKALLEVHRLRDQRQRTATIAALEIENAAIEKLVPAVKAFKRGELQKRIQVDPEVGDIAEQFCTPDRAFHLAPLRRLGLGVNATMLEILLDRMRLSASCRATIIERIPTSCREHKAIIKAVGAMRGPGSERAVKEAVLAHFDSSTTSFGVGQMGEEGRAGLKITA